MDLAACQRIARQLGVGVEAQLERVDKRPLAKVVRVCAEQRVLGVNLSQLIWAGANRLLIKWRAGPFGRRKLAEQMCG